MQFNSYIFIFAFLPIFLLLYFTLGKRWIRPVLIAGGAVFYALAGWKSVLVLAVSTLLNALYFGRTLITLFRLREDQITSQPRTRGGWCFNASCAALSAVTVALGVFSAPVLSALRRGLEMFG